MRADRSADISTSIIPKDPIRALTKRRLIKPTSPRCPSAWQPNPGRGSTYRRGNSVQTTGTSSDVEPVAVARSCLRAPQAVDLPERGFIVPHGTDRLHLSLHAPPRSLRSCVIEGLP